LVYEKSKTNKAKLQQVERVIDKTVIPVMNRTIKRNELNNRGNDKQQQKYPAAA